ncbi:MAG TPA: diguanylate cyclase [Rhizomicrobium sp.]|jgi:diguanylate cyclase (GGDEF)-like protein
MRPFTRTTSAPRALGRRIIPWFVAVSAILLTVGIGVYTSVTRLISAGGWVEHSYQVLDALDLTMARFIDAQSAERGYVATCSRVLLLPYRTDLPRIYSGIAYLRLLTADNPSQQRHIERLHGELAGEFSRMNMAIADAATGNVKKADTLVVDPQDRLNVNGILAITHEMEVEERELLAKRVASVNFFATTTLIASALGLLACVAILGFVFWLVRRETREREKAQEKLYQTNERLQDSMAELRMHGDAARSIALLGELLQTCRNTGEALAITARHLTQLFPDVSGTIGLYRNSRDGIEVPQTMGSGEGFAREFAPDECWGLRRGRTHHYESSGSEPHCDHLPAEIREAFCFPMIAQGETLGALTIGTERGGGFTDSERQTMQTIVEQLSLALANLKLQETLRHQSLRDPLTGLFNRRYLDDALARETARMKRRGEPLSVVIADIDHFKRFNDTHGHQGGDALLAEFGLLLASQARGEDIACRYGGEEFALILPGAAIGVAEERANRLREAVKHLHIRLHGQPLGLVTLSAGIASFPADGQSGAAVIGAADAALYRAKRNGRDRVERAGQGGAIAVQSAAG